VQGVEGSGPDNLIAPWRCPVCESRLSLAADGKSWKCVHEHNFDIAHQRYVNLLDSRGRSRPSGDSGEAVRSRQRFLASGAYDPVTAALVEVAAGESSVMTLDVGCGEGRHTRRQQAPLVLGIDVSKSAVAKAAKAHPHGWYAVASAARIPLDNASVDLALNVFGPVVPDELARVIRPGGRVLAVNPAPQHLTEVRALVYSRARPHEIKPPLRNATDWFIEVDQIRLTFQFALRSLQQLQDLFTMTPYRWHAPPFIYDRFAQVIDSGFCATADLQLTVYRRIAIEKAAS
jgi:23S rRNA (guanine745-N1)-methyltransferase